MRQAWTPAVVYHPLDPFPFNFHRFAQNLVLKRMNVDPFRLPTGMTVVVTSGVALLLEAAIRSTPTVMGRGRALGHHRRQSLFADHPFLNPKVFEHPVGEPLAQGQDQSASWQGAEDGPP